MGILKKYNSITLHQLPPNYINNGICGNVVIMYIVFININDIAIII